jgi:hypothetical protein
VIIWLASFPKSGNTLLRALLSSYFFSKSGDFEFGLIKNIKKFPNKSFFVKLGIDLNNPEQLAKSYIKAQELINKKKGIKFLKTHSSFCKMNNNYSFTNSENTAGAIYLVRDPRNVVTSCTNHFNVDYDQATKYVTENWLFGEETIPEYIGSWIFNYNSWKILSKVNRLLLVKYEELISDTENCFLKILNFINFISKNNSFIDKEKLKRCIISTQFNKLQNLEKKYGFDEATIDNQNRKNKFFNLGKKNNWENILDKEIKKKIEQSCKDEMFELGYLK